MTRSSGYERKGFLCFKHMVCCHAVVMILQESTYITLFPFQLISQPSCGFSFKGIVERAFWFEHASKPEYASTKFYILPYVQDMSIAADMLLLSIKWRFKKLGSMLLG